MQDTGEFLFLKSKKSNLEECVIFDFDGTLATKANADKPYVQEYNRENYVFLHGVEEKLFGYIEREILVVIISNQLYMTEEKEFMFLNVYNHFNKRITILVANRKNNFRKPNIGFIDILKTKYKIRYYCGDAIGDSDFPPFQYSNVDFEFTQNADIRFKSPLKIFGSNFLTEVPTARLVIMMGIQGSGKTSVAKRLEEENSFIRYSQDEVGKLSSKLKKIEQDLINGHNVVVDATHRKNELRAQFIEIAEKLNIEWVIFWCVRDGRPFNNLREKKVHNAGLALYVKEFERPLENFVVIS